MGVTQKIADPLIAANGVKHGKLMFATTGGEIGLACHALDSEFIDA